MVRSLTARISALCAIVSMTLLAFVWLLVDASDRTRAGFGWVNHSAVVIETTDNALGDLREAESGERGYVLTRNRRFVESFDARVTSSLRAMDRVVRLTSDNPLQNGRARDLRRLMGDRIAALREPMRRANGGDFAAARTIICNGRGRETMALVSAHAQTFLEEERALQISRSASANLRLAWLKRLAMIGGVLVALLNIVGSSALVRGIRRPARILKTAMASLGAGDRRVRITAAMGSIEFDALAGGYNRMADRLESAVADQVHSERQLQLANVELLRNSDALRSRGEIIELLGGMAHRMQAARTDEELAQVIRVFVPRVLPHNAGLLYAHNNSRNRLVPIAGWGGIAVPDDGFAPAQCWALRRGQSHHVDTPGSDIVCDHVPPGDDTYLCEPLLAGGEVIGTLYIRGRVDAECRFRLCVMAENIASALVNHRLQRDLREQTIRDPLTGLFNRRYMEEALALEIARASRTGTPLSVVMCDVDHFKRFNDEYGHDAGDAVLRAVANEMRGRFRDGDVVCRFGGEEFTIIAPGTSAATLAGRVEAVRLAITDLNVRQGGRRLGAVSMSFGIADWRNGMARDGTTLVQAADAALYRAKRQGRNQAIVDLADAA